MDRYGETERVVALFRDDTTKQLEVTVNASKEITSGKATINLPPGDYSIVLKVEGKLPSGAPTSATVIAGQYVEVSIELDSGMR